MGEEEPKKVEPGAIDSSVSAPLEDHEKVSDEKVAIVPVQKVDPAVEKSSKGSTNRDVLLARVATEKRCALIKAWEENEKAKADNKAHKKFSAIGSWENSKKVAVEAQLKMIEENFEKKKAQYAEKMKNKVAEIRKAAEEKRAMVEAKRGEECLKVEETAAKLRATGYPPKKFLGCFSS